MYAEVTEELVAVVDEIDNGVAYFTAVASSGAEFMGRTVASSIEVFGIGEGEEFAIIATRSGMGGDVMFRPIPRRFWTEDEIRQLDKSLDHDFEGLEFDEDN